jgi:FAD dependent monooxygenase
MTADLAIGANMAVESAVYLCNILHRELKANPNRRMSTSELSDLFAEYQNGRFGRAKAFATLSGQATRRHTYQTYLGRFYIGYIAPYLMSIHTQKMAESFVQSPKLDYAPVRTINENAEGWHLGKQKEKEAKVGLVPYVLLTSMVGATIAYLAMAK